MKLKMPARIALVFSLVLVLIAIYFIFLDNSGSINPVARDFSFGRIDNVTEIHLTEEKQSITLTKSKDGWLANGTYIVKDQLPELFLKTINDIKIKAPASKEIRNQLRDQLLNSKHIDIYKGHRKVCSYYILFDSANTQETYLMKKWAKLPLGAEITGLKYPVAELYHCDLSYWKAKYVFPSDPDNIDWVNFTNSKNKQASFKLEKSNKGEIKVLSPEGELMQGTDPIAANDYFASLARVQYLKEIEPSDSIDMEQASLQVPDFNITVHFTKSEISLKFFPLYKLERAGRVKNPDLFIGISTYSKAPFIGRYIDFDPLIRSRSYFRNK